MNVDELIERKLIKNKEVYIFERHNFALKPWAIARRISGSPLTLFTLDHHTDNRPAFSKHVSHHYNKERTTMKVLASNIKFSNDNSLDDAILKLNHDEHIDAAIKSGILLKAFIVTNTKSNDDPPSNEQADYGKKLTEYAMMKILHSNYKDEIEKPKIPFTYPVLGNSIYVIGNKAVNGSHEKTYDFALESSYIKEKLTTLREMDPSVELIGDVYTDFILDIDLDYFHTKKSIHPDDSNFFTNWLDGVR